MKCVSYKQPWASLVILGEKGVETRSSNWTVLAGRWHAVHASSTWTSFQDKLLDTEPFRTALARHGITRMNATQANLPRRAILGVAFISTLGRTADAVVSDTERAFGDYTPGRYTYHVGERFALAEPILFTGRLGVFDLPAAVERKVMLGLQIHDDLPAEFASEDLLNEAVNAARLRRLQQQEVDRLTRSLTGRDRDTRTPIERMIDQATGYDQRRGK